VSFLTGEHVRAETRVSARTCSPVSFFLGIGRTPQAEEPQGFPILGKKGIAKGG